MGSVNVLKELEELRSMLDTPKKVYTPGSRLDDSSDGAGDADYYAAGRTSLQVTPTAQPITGSTSRGPHYAHALNHAERSVDRLGKAIDLAEEEMDAALKRTTDVHRSQLKSKEAELREMQRLMQDKERAVSSLRDTLATTKRTYEGRVSQLEGSLAVKDADIAALREELSAARADAEGLAYTARRESAAVGHELDSLRMREAELATTARARGDELSRLSSQLRTERDERRAAVGAAEELRRTVAVLQEELGTIKARSGAEIDALQRRLKAERSIRKACEKWLRAELRSREEYDTLLRAIRESCGSGSAASGAPAALRGLPAALARLPGVGRDAAEVEELLQRLKEKEGLVSPREDPLRSAYGGGLLGESDMVVRSVEDENRRLKAELLAAKRLLTEARR